MDYTFTLLGGLKAINHPSLSTANDPGRDNAATGNNKNVAKDAIGMGFTYHTDDFVSKSPSTPSPFATGNASFAPLTGDGLWSGQIGAWSLKTAAITVPPGQTYARNGDLTGDRIIYDRLGRVRQVSSLVSSNGTWTSDGQGGWSAFYVYDQNSSQTRIQRWGKLDGVTSSLYDDATITTQSPTSNVVDAVVDAGTDVVAGYSDLRDQTPANTAVDAKGRVTDESVAVENRGNTWTSDDAQKTATAGTTQAHYLYDAGGRVVRIRVDNAGIDSTIYRIPGGSGGDAAVYKRGGQAPSNETVPMEWSVYGLGFVGVSRQTGEQEEGPVYTRTVGTKFYPLTDHLGSVRVVVGDVKLPVAGGYEADVLASYDYEIYGGPRPGRSLDVSAYWRYGFQGMLKQNELSGNTAATSDYTTLFRTYDARNGRWRSHDPIHQPWESTYLGLAGNPAMLTDPWGLNAGDPLENAPSNPNDGDYTMGSNGRMYLYDCEIGWGLVSNSTPREVRVSAGWLLASDFGYGESTPEGHRAFIPGFLFSCLPDYYYHHGYLVPEEDYNDIFAKAAYYLWASNRLPHNSYVNEAPHFNYNNVDEEIAPELHRIGNKGDALDPADDIWFVGSGAGSIAKAALRSSSRKIGGVVARNAAQRTAQAASGSVDDVARTASKATQVWPSNNGFLGTPNKGVLQPGSIVDRFGSPSGRFVAPQGTPFPARSLPSDYVEKPLNAYEILKPIQVDVGLAAPWFGQPGMGIQMLLPEPVEVLIQKGFIRAYQP